MESSLFDAGGPRCGLLNSPWSWIIVIVVIVFLWGYHAFYK
jgi:hypothetical protein